MTYQPHTWTKGETITAQLLQNMDNGVAAAIDALESAFGSNYTMGSKEYKVNFTNLGKDISANAIQGTTLTATDAISGTTISGTTLTATATTGTGLTVNGETNLQGALIVGTDNTAVDTTIKGKLIVTGKGDNNAREAADLTGKVNITGNTDINGATTLAGPLTVTGQNVTSLSGSLTVDGNSFINSNFYHQVNQAHGNDGSTTWFPNGVFYAYYKTIDLGMRGEMINADQPREIIISEENSSTINLAGTRLNISNTTTKISSPTTEIRGNLIIGDDPTNNIYTHTVTIKANSTLNGVTTIKKLDKLIVGDSTSTEDNEIYGFTTISNLTVGTPNVESDSETQTYSGIATFNTDENFLHGQTTIDYLTTLKVLSADEAHWIHGDLTLGTLVLRPNNENPKLSSQTTQDNLKINSRNITIGLQSTSEYPVIVDNSSLTIYAETSMVGATEIQNLEYLNVTGNSNNFITGSTTITNLTVPSLIIRDQTTTNGGYAFTINDGKNLRLSQNNNNSNNFDFYFKDTGELIFSGTGYFDNALTLKNNLIFETESSNQSTSYNYIIKPSLSSANHYSLQMNINKGSSDIHTILTYYDNTEEQILYLGNSAPNNTMSSTVTSLFLEAKDHIVLQGGEGNGVEVDSNLYLQSGKELRFAKSNTQNDYVILTAAQLEQIKSYCNITD